MTLKNLIKHTIGVFSITMLLSMQSFSQTICKLGARNNFHQNANKDEYSGLAYHVERGLFFMPVDDPIIGNIHFKGYDVQKSAAFNVALLDPDLSLSKKDFEGLTYLEGNYFVLLEEKESKIYFIQYMESGSGNPFFEVLSGHETGIAQSTIDTKDGLEGISYDPHSYRLYVVREHSDVRLFSIPITLPSSGFLGSINEQQKSSTALPFNVEPSGLFHLGKVFPSDHDSSNNLLVLDDKQENILEYKLELDSGGNLLENSPKLVRVVNIPAEPKPEGIAVYNSKLYIASEKKSGGLSSYIINPGSAICNTDCSQGEIETWNAITCSCESAANNPKAGCTEINACNFDEKATIDDCSCVYENAVCDDGKDHTINDRIDENCNCKGVPTCQCEHVN